MTHSKTPTTSSLPPYRVLSLDGGGMRGLYTLGLLKSLSERFCRLSKMDIGKGFNLIVGTSTGGIIATGLATGVAVESMIEIYRGRGKDIFTDPKPKNKINTFWWAIRNLCKSANTNNILRNELQKVFKEETVEEVYTRRQIALCVTAVNVVNNCPKIFKTPHDSQKHADNKRNLLIFALQLRRPPSFFQLPPYLTQKMRDCKRAS